MTDDIDKLWHDMPIDWLLEGEPFVRYRSLVDLLGRLPDDHDVLDAKNSITRHKPVAEILDKQHADGYWGKPTDVYMWWPKKDTTFWLLGILGDFGLDRRCPKIARACEYVFGTQLPGGGFGWAPPPTAGDCFTGILTEALAKLGYVSDPRLQKAYDWLLNRQRLDGGFWCKNTGLPGRSKECEPSCAFATLCVMAALSEHPAYRNADVSRRGSEFLLSCWQKRGEIKYAGHDSQIGSGWEKLKYPFTDYRILKYLDVLSNLASIKSDPRMAGMMDLLVGKRDAAGRFRAESIHKVWSEFDFGQKKLPSRWITFLAYRIIRRLLA